MDDKLETIFTMQKALNDHITAQRKLNYSREEWLEKRCLAMIDEIGEVLHELDYKWWKNSRPIEEAKLKEELVDVLHFFIGMCLDAGMTAQELFEVYLAKNRENYLRQQGLSNKSGYKAE